MEVVPCHLGADGFDAFSHPRGVHTRTAKLDLDPVLVYGAKRGKLVQRGIATSDPRDALARIRGAFRRVRWSPDCEICKNSRAAKIRPIRTMLFGLYCAAMSDQESNVTRAAKANQDTVNRFYIAFQKRDADAMNACYAPAIKFSDPVFGPLDGDRARAMWQMLNRPGGGCLELQYQVGTVDDSRDLASAVRRSRHRAPCGQSHYVEVLVRRRADRPPGGHLRPLALGVDGPGTRRQPAGLDADRPGPDPQGRRRQPR